MHKKGFGQVLTEIEFIALKKNKKMGFDATYQKFADHVFSLSMHLVRNKDTASDILQDVFEKLLNKSSNINAAETVGMWLKQTTINACMEYFRKTKRQGNLYDSEMSEGQLECVAETSMDDHQILAYLTQLPSLQRAVVYSYAIKDMRHIEIGASLGIEEANSRQLYRRGLNQLKTWLKRGSNE